MAINLQKKYDIDFYPVRKKAPSFGQSKKYIALRKESIGLPQVARVEFKAPPELSNGVYFIIFKIIPCIQAVINNYATYNGRPI